MAIPLTAASSPVLREMEHQLAARDGERLRSTPHFSFAHRANFGLSGTAQA
ncbi:hypothetical protein ACU4GD_40540 [Cupriavidus basilensis]